MMKLLIVAVVSVAACAATNLVQQAYYPASQLYTYPAYASYAYQPAAAYQVATHQVAAPAHVATPVIVQKPGIKYISGYSPVSSVYYGAYSPYSSYYYPSVGYKPLLIYGNAGKVVQAAPGGLHGQQGGEAGPVQGEARPEKPTRIQQATVKDSYHY